MNQSLTRYFSEMGQKGGRKSRRTLSPEKAKAMVAVREARRLYKHYFSRCFWSYSPNYKVTAEDIPWVAEQLRKNGDRVAWLKARKLCP